MNNSQTIVAVLTALTPTVTVLIALLVQRQDTRDLRAELQKQMIDLRTDLQSQMINLRNQVHADLLMIHERVAKVEARQGS